jgi:hypothetical protein
MDSALPAAFPENCLRVVGMSILLTFELMLAEGDAHLACHDLKALVPCPQTASVQATGGKEVSINQSDTPPHQVVALDEEQDFIVLNLGYARHRMETRDDLLSVVQISAGQLSEDERVNGDRLRVQ